MPLVSLPSFVNLYLIINLKILIKNVTGVAAADGGGVGGGGVVAPAKGNNIHTIEQHLVCVWKMNGC